MISDSVANCHSGDSFGVIVTQQQLQKQQQKLQQQTEEPSHLPRPLKLPTRFTLREYKTFQILGGGIGGSSLLPGRNPAEGQWQDTVLEQQQKPFSAKRKRATNMEVCNTRMFDAS